MTGLSVATMAKFVLPGALSVMATTVGVRVENSAHREVMEFTARPVNPTLTQPTHFRVVDLGADGSDVTELCEDRTKTVSLLFGMDQSAGASIWKRSFEQLDRLRGLSDGWLGPESCGPSSLAEQAAFNFLLQLRQALPEGPAPNLSADSEGCIVLTWNRAGFNGSLSFYPDNEAAFYIENAAGNSSRGVFSMVDDFPEGLVEVLEA